MQESLSDVDKLKIKLFGNDPKQFESDVGILGKLDGRIARIEKILYAVGFLLAALQFARPYIERAFHQ